MHSQTHIHTNNKDFKNIYFTLTEQMLISFASTDKIMLFENLIEYLSVLVLKLSPLGKSLIYLANYWQ